MLWRFPSMLVCDKPLFKRSRFAMPSSRIRSGVVSVFDVESVSFLIFCRDRDFFGIGRITLAGRR